MIETSLFGIYVPGLLLLAGGALACAWWVRCLLSVLGVYRWVWHPPLFDLGLYLLSLYSLVELTGALSS